MSTIVLLRGLAREQGHWGAFPAALDNALSAALGDALGGPPVYAVDLAGNGREHRARSATSVQALMAECRNRVLARSGPGPYRLIGLSLGGMVATAWMLAHPDEVQAAVLINSSLRPCSPFWRRMRPASALRLLATLAQPAPRAERAILALTSRAPEQHAEVLADWVSLRRARPVSAANALRQLAAAARYRVPAGAPRIPVLVMASLGDRLVDPSCSRDIAATWHCRLVEHPDAGHDLPLDDGHWVAAQIARWLSELAPDGSR